MLVIGHFYMFLSETDRTSEMYMLRFKFSPHKNVLKPSCFVFLHENKVKEVYPFMLITLMLLNTTTTTEQVCLPVFIGFEPK